MVPLRYNVRSLLVRRFTTFVTAFGIMLVVLVYAGVSMFATGTQKAISAGGRPDNVIVMRKGSDAELSSAIGNEYVSLFRAMPQVAQAAGSVAEIAIVVSGERKAGGISNLLVRGTTAEGYTFRPEIKIVSGRMPKPGTSEAIVGKGIVGRFAGTSVGDKLELRRNRPLEIVGVFASDGSSYESEVIGDLDVIRKALGREGVVSSVRVRLNSPSDFESYRAAIEGDKRFSMKVTREDEYYRKQASDTSSFFVAIFGVLSALLGIAAIIGAAITMNGAIAHRTREIGTLRALGFSGLAILVSFLFESVFIALVGGVVGIAATVLIAMFVRIPVMNFATFSEVVIVLTPSPSGLVSALVVAVVMGVIGGLLPAIRAARISPVEAMRG